MVVLLFLLFIKICGGKCVPLHRVKKITFISMFRGFYTTLVALLMAFLGLHAQRAGQLDLFCGAELNYRDVNFVRLYDVLLRATPGVKFYMGKDWMISGQAYFPIWNEGYGMRGNMFRLNMADVSKEVHFSNANQHFKFSAGLFGSERYGIDVRWAYPINAWLLLHARMGYTGYWNLGFHLEGETESEFSNSDWSVLGIGGASVWLAPWSTEFRVSGGRYINDEYGVEGEIIRHFKHCSVSLFSQHHEAYKSTGGTHRNSGGFRVVMMIPPYEKKRERVNYRPASNFRLTYNAQSDGYSMKKYNTDPEENERTEPIRIPWGTGIYNE